MMNDDYGKQEQTDQKFLSKTQRVKVSA